MNALPAIPEIGPIEQVILQPTPFCNLNCSYCYLPEKSRLSKKKMKVETAIQSLEMLARSKRLSENVEIRWHAGEPLVVPQDFYATAIREIRKVVPKSINIIHSLQTNATLLSDQWCELFLCYEIRVGVSIDGPAHLHDRYRLTRNGRGTHEKVMKGIVKLVEHEVPFEIIAVITAEALKIPDELFSFFKSLSPTKVAFNIEESECEYSSNLLHKEDFAKRYTDFLSRIYELQKKSKLFIREIEEIKSALLYGEGDRHNLQVHPFGIVTIDWAGNVYTYSPELAGMQHPKYASFSFGNVLENPMEEIIQSDNFKRISTDVLAGVELCRKQCEYFSLCGGGAPGNKLYENDSFCSTETGYCQARFQIPTDVILADLEAQKSSGASISSER